ncbi:regulatory protein, tetR family [Amycolatopsis xylanica]|uniref:Regulatory protein, tetR family n=1 Tax=Amycolatopsis xylanica TaxID=589385 RepID=A0A1H3MXL9_9PSEU|nr:regulatory protein, tetR family [Amycolatopsis xylanica]
MLWDQTDPPAPKQRLSVSHIVRTAVELADADGLEAVSMAKIAERLGFTAMSLYRHVKSKDDLLLLMLDWVAAVPPALDEPHADWRAGLRFWCQEQWELLRAHPWIVHIPITGPPVTPNHLTWTDRALGMLGETRLSERDKVGVVLLLASYLHTTARFTAERGPTTQAARVPYSALLGDLVEADRFPALRAAVDAGAFDYASSKDKAEREFDYSFGLARILDGVEALIAQRSP